MTVNLHPDQPSMSEEQINKLFSEVQFGMTRHVTPSLTELYFPNPNNPEKLENGTGTFVEVDGNKLLLTNDHVILNKSLHHSFNESENYFWAAPQRYGVEKPIDVGVAKVDAQLWALHGANCRAIGFERFAERHETVQHEILWIAGYPGERVKQFDSLQLSVCEATPTQEYLFHDNVQPHEEFDPQFHFAVYYSPANAKPILDAYGSTSPGRSNPHGLSGSLVWNTRRLECFYAGHPWSPGLAVVTGIVWGWPNSIYLIATKVEHFREILRELAKLPNSPTGEGSGPYSVGGPGLY
jgi:hypothetical protein